MRAIDRTPMWIGTARDARNLHTLAQHEIAAVIDLALEEPPAELPRQTLYCRLPLLDGAGNSQAALRRAAEMVRSLLDDDAPFVVACSGGMSRSPAIAAAGLALAQGVSLAAAVQIVCRDGPRDIHPGLLADLQRVFTSD